MTRKIFLTISVASMFAIGVVASLVPFFSSMSPSEAAYNNLPTVDLSKINNGQYLSLGPEEHGQFLTSWLILKTHSGQLHLYSFPFNQQKYIMPDLTWGRYGGLCNDLRPEEENGLIKPNGLIKCHDTEIYEGLAKEWQWSYNGKNKGKYTADLQVPQYTIEGDTLFLLKK